MIRKKMNYKDIILVLVMFFGILSVTSAQKIDVTGRVTTISDGLALPGASILVVGTTNGTQTDIDGKYVIKNVPINAVLMVSYIGVKSKSVKVDGKSTINFAMQSDTENLDEVVVVGYGSSRKSELTEAVSTVKNNELTKSTGTSIESALQGRVSGVKVTTNEGGPGAGLKISVRGTSSINGTNEPLYVIDGVPIQKDVATGGEGGIYSSLPSDPMSGINPNDVESIEILKDASATAIYGSRGANGVVLITTKQGKAGKLAITYDSSYGTERISNKLDLLNGREYYQYQYLRNPNGSLFTDVNNPFYVDPNKIDEASLGIDWQDEVYRQAFMQNQQFNFRGGSDKTSFFASLGYLNQEGIIVDNDFERYTGLLNVNANSDKFKLTGSMNFSQSNRKGSVYASGGPNNDFAGVVSKVFFARPLGGRDALNSDPDLSTGSDEELDFLTNPYLYATQVTNDNKQSRITANINTFYEFAKNFEMQTRIGGSLTFDESNRYFPTTTAAGKRLNGYAQILRTDSKQFSFEHLFHYKNDWGKHNLKAMAGYTIEKGSRDFLNIQNQGFVYDNTGVFDIGVGTDLIAPINSLVEFSLNSYLGRFNYSYDNKYFLTFTGRIDGSSKFPTANKYAFFPSGSFAWNMHKEKFLENANWINNLRVRYSVGTSGNQAIPSYESLALLNDVTYSFGGGLQTGLVFSQLANENLKWETSIQNNLGFDLGFFKNKISLSIDGFIKRTHDVLLAIPVSSVVGVDGNPYQNAGSIENKGLEVTLTTKNFNTKKFNWTTDFNISVYKNKITSLGEIDEFYADFGGGEFSNLMIYRKGGEIGEFFGYKTDGIFKNQEDFDNSPKANNSQLGGWKIKDINGDGIIDTNDRTVIGSNQPKYFGGLTNNFQFNNFDLSFFFAFSVGQEVYNANRFVLENPQDDRNKSKSILDNSFLAPTYDDAGNLISVGNPDGNLPAIGTNAFLSPIDEYVEDASFLRLQNVTIGYTIPLAERLKISKFRVYMSGNNLLLFTKYKGYDPDVNTTRNNGLIKGVDFGSYPRSINLMWGLNVAF
ncbi:TonB-linked outer membrane protein, SusC/RagA family [Flavobacterium flevense]|uniref:SusC/RagA family TonB-linked outer membrane protein n=1 Tax=Flavobacterium flevense TaxID=983 RepID=A0A4Y4B1J9_9FLAO|nr:TonB-dependent receptor [Flavobacterium flevense]GEC72764.1 SusC/RagA family TonB-linked outer membrane protein [Flavobacterium flevense]SHM16449.1 TonB-linked outer membrane protein, SusC/RagA family [Flavobacterium flevense]